MPQTNIILTGFMGTGKTTRGQLLAEKIGYQFVDTDALIEQQTGKTIADLFQSYGETAFRKLESELVENLAEQQGLVIATGGGLVLNPNNVAMLSKTGKIICLTASPEEILARVSKQQGVRPLLQGENPLGKITQLLQQRDSVYRQFPQLSTSKFSRDQLVGEILKLTNGLD
jgi:shikimate kinase